MAFSLSPSVDVREVDLSLYVPNVASSIAGIVGLFQWGPVEEITLVDSERTLVSKFGKPDDSNFKDWFSAFNFLAYSNNLKVVRVVDDAVALNAAAGESSVTQGTFDSANSAGLLIKNRDTFDQVTLGADVAFYARYPGTLGNKIKVEAFDASVGTNVPESTKGKFAFAPDGDEIHVAVWYAEDGTNYQLVEQFYGSKDPSSVDNSTQGSNFIGSKINNTSQYIYVNTPSLFTGTPGTYSDVDFSGALSGGLDGYAIGSDGDDERSTGWTLFSDSEYVDVNLLITGGASSLAGKSVIDNIAEVRRDCVVLLSPQSSDVVGSATPVASIITTRDSLTSTSYGFMDGNYKYQYDKYNDEYRWVPLNGDMAGLMALTDYTNDAWWSPAGLNRGSVKNVVKLGFNPSKAERDTLYSDAVNPVVQFRGEGVVLFGDKTLQTKPSAFDRINVRRLFLVLEKAISTAAKYQLFEFNDRQTRLAFTNMVEPFLRNVKARRGVYDYKVVADETNNTSTVIDNNQFIGDIYIKPAKSINVIQLNFVAVSNSVSFDEVLLNS